MASEAPRQIWKAPILNNNRPRLIERCADLIHDGRAGSFLYLAASHPLLEVVTDGLLDGEKNRGMWGTLPVYLFHGFVRHLISTAIDETSLLLPKRLAIDREELPVKSGLVALIIRRLAREDRLKAIAPLAHSDGCVNTIAGLIGEIQRAAKTPAEFEAIISARERDFEQTAAVGSSSVPRQSEFDREVALIYSTYATALDRFQLTEDDADQLRALSVLRGELNGAQVTTPTLEGVRLLILDGFFDFTPVQGEILRLLIPRIPEVIVNVNGDDLNEEIFRPYEDTIKQLESMGVNGSGAGLNGERQVKGALQKLRPRLFNTKALSSLSDIAELSNPEKLETDLASEIEILECSDRETEVRTIAKEIKRLVLLEAYKLSQIAVVVRQRAAYANSISRIFDDEGIPSTVERRIAMVDIPAVRAAMKLFQLLRESGERTPRGARIGELADLLKSEYFKPVDDETQELRRRFESDCRPLLADAEREGVDPPAFWDVDELENAIAFVGSELRIDDWLSRARRLTGRTTKAIEDDVIGDEEAEPFSALDAESEEKSQPPPEIEQPGSQVQPRRAREVHPAVIAWTATLISHLRGLTRRVPIEAQPEELHHALLLLLEQLQFASQIKARMLAGETLAPEASRDVRALEGLRQAFVAAIRAIEIAEVVTGGAAPGEEAAPPVRLATLLDEVLRCLRSQTLRTAEGDRDGLKILEATDVRGLEFRALFIAGLIEGGFPRRVPRDWIYSHEERDRLRQYGLALEDISPATLLKEEHYFYQAACRATERLYLTQPLMLEGDIETVPSYYIEEIRQAVLPYRVASHTVRRDFDRHDPFTASTGTEAAISLIRQSERPRSGEESALDPNSIPGLIAWAQDKKYMSPQALDRIRIERERAGKRFTHFDGDITGPELRVMLSEKFGSSHVFSASELSLFGKCPFKFYAERLLKLEPRGEAALDLKAMDAGRLLHEALRRFFERHRSERLTLLDREMLRRELQEIADDVFDEHERIVPPLNPQVWRIDREIRKVLLDQVLIFEMGLQAAADDGRQMIPAYFELGFGMKDDDGDPHSIPDHVELLRPESSEENPEKLLIRGRIDRVDLAADGTAIAYDYKLSRGAGLDDLREGRDLQIGIYLTALEQLFLRGQRIAGGGYYVLQGKLDRRNRGLYRASLVEYTKLGRGVGANLPEEKWLEARREMVARIWEFSDAMKVGRFRVKPSAPKESCPRCDYSAVCRYEPFRIRAKESS